MKKILLFNFLLLFGLQTFAQTCQSSDASSYSTWGNGNNDNSSGFGNWSLSTSVAGGFFIGSSFDNDMSEAGSSNINTSGKAWGMFANTGGSANAIRSFNTPLAVGGSISFSMDNGSINSLGPTVGIGIQNASGENLMEFYFRGGQSFYELNDLTGSNTSTGLSFSRKGLDLIITRTAAGTYSINIVRKENSASAIFNNRNLFNPAGGQVPAQIRFFNFNAGNGGDFNAYFNNLKICPPCSVTGGTVGSNQSICRGAVPASFGENNVSTGTGTLTYQWEISTDNNIFSAISSATGTTYAEPSALTQTTYYRRVTINTQTTTGATCTANSNTVTVTVAANTWTGAVNNSWNNAGNWSCGRIPVTNEAIAINTGTPQLDIDFTVAGSLMLSGTGSLIITPNKILTISGSANFGGNSVTIKSTSAGTGSIGQITGTLSGATNVTVERYINSGQRSFRTLASSVNSTASIKNNWQEGVNNTSLTVNNNGLGGDGFGTHITGNTSVDNGFDVTQTSSPSMFTYNGATGAYASIPNTNATTLNAATGYLLFVRGDRSTITRLDGGNTFGTTTLRATGTLLTGDVTYPLSGNGKFTLISNPYSAAVNWSTIFSAATALENFYTYVDPNVGERGGYVTVTNAGVRNNNAANINGSIHIQSGQAFFVKAAGATVPTITIKETHKSITNNINVFRTGSQEQMSIGLYFNLNGANRVADGVNVLFNNNYSAKVDANDAEQLTNFDEDLSINRANKFLSIEGRPLADQADTIFLNMTHMKQKDYTFEFSPASFNAPGLQAYLQDNFLLNETNISLTEQTIVPFTVNSSTSSSASDRFRVVFRAASVLPINFTNVKAFEKGSSIQIEWNLGNEQNMKQYQVEKSTDGRTFTKTGSQVARTISSTDSYQWLDVTPNNGNNFYRIKAIENGELYKYSQVVNVKTGKNNSAISVYPNPVKGNVINLQMVNQEKGRYSISLVNALGQQLYLKEFNHLGGSANETLNVGTKISKGIYNLQITANGKSIVERVIIE